MTDAERIAMHIEAEDHAHKLLGEMFETAINVSLNEFQKYIDLIKCEDCGAANMTIYMTGVDRKRRCRKCHAEYIRPNPPARLKGKKK